MKTERIAEIALRANALKRAGFYADEEVRWLAEYVRSGASLLVEIELLLTNAEEMMKRLQTEEA